MKITEDYLLLTRAFPEGRKLSPVLVSKTELAEALFCSERNAKLIIGKLAATGWLRFEPGRGRGNKSRLYLDADPAPLLLQEAEDKVRGGDAEAAFRLIGEYAGTDAVKREFMDWFYRYLGYQSDGGSSRVVEKLRLPIYRPIVSMDPGEAFYALDGYLVELIFGTLVCCDDDESAMISQGIAHHWEYDEAGMSWTFHLRKGIRFHHGRELDAEDVKFSYERLKHTAHAWAVRSIGSMEALSSHAIRITLKERDSYFLRVLSYSTCSIVPRDLYGADGSGSPELPVGTGPFKAVRRTRGSLLLQAFDSYFGYRPHLDELELIVLPNADSLEKNDDAGFVHVLTGEQTLAEKIGWKHIGMMSGTSLLTVNRSMPGLLEDPFLRRALNVLIDRQAMVTELGFPRISPSSGFVWGNDDKGVDEFDPDAGMKLLSKSNYAGETITLATFPRHQNDAEWISSSLSQYGVRVEVVLHTWAGMLLQQSVEAAHLILFEAVLSEGPIRLLEYLQSSTGFISSHMSPETRRRTEQILGRFKLADTEETRRDCLDEIEGLLKSEGDILFLNSKAVSAMTHPSLRDVRLSHRGWVDFRNAWVMPDSKQIKP
ncbi:ABC transporter substrate-binding protein [Paenibacillus sp. P22]|uniref:ABC transporter substrate-binding protein n=1 Tax=Paenibacillus sp. P22 TaxID=483908 RepID=UPI00065F6F67|nr:ABC transporter substrate-binding protein [Paenibacillus sp. P22]